jgi:DNA-binding winged helix-turn-helix (wHTH) protein
VTDSARLRTSTVNGPAPDSPPYRFRFGEVELDERSLCLTRGGNVVKTQPLTLDLLRYFLHHRGRVVSRDELLREVWADAVVSDAALARAVSGLRRALGDQAQDIETVRSRGYRFRAQVAVRPATPAAPPPDAGETVRLIGRAAEIAEARELFASASAGHGSVMLVRGAAGMGKTRLALELAAVARDLGFEVLWGRCMEVVGTPPFFPWTEMVRDLLGELSPADRDVLARAFVPRERPNAPPADADSARFRVFQTLVRALEARSRRRPLALFLDDLHRADIPSLRLLCFVASSVSSSRIALVGMHRPCPLTPLAELAARSEIRARRLRGLDRGETTALVASLTDEPPTEARVTWLLEHTGGNPFFLREVIRSPERRAPPRRVAEVLLERVSALSPVTRDVLACASVCGCTFDAPLVAHMLGVEVIDVLAALEPALRERLVELVSTTAQRYRFAHALVRDTLYDHLTPADRALHHAAAGRALEERGSDDLGELAEHWLEAASLGHGSRAVAATKRAAIRAMEQLAFEEAKAKCERLLEAAEVLDVTNEDLLELTLLSATASLSAGLRAEASAAFERAIDIARDLRDGAALARAIEGLAETRLDGDDVVDEGWEELLGEGIDAAGAAPPIRARLLARVAFERWLGTPGCEPPVDLARGAVEMARRSSDADALAFALSRWHRLATARDDHGASLAVSQELLRLRPRMADATARIEACSARAWDMLRLGRRRDFDAVLLELEAEVARSPTPRSHWYAHLHRASRAHLMGRFADAEAESGAAWELCRDCPSPFAELCRAVQELSIHFDWGSSGDWDARLRTLALRGGTVTWELAVRVLDASAAAGDSRALLARLCADGFAPVRHHLTFRNALGLAAELAARVGATEAAPALHACIEPHARLCDVHMPGLMMRGSLARPLGMAAALAGRFEEACSHLSTAVLRDRATGAQPMVAYGLVEHARAIAARDGRLSDGAKALLDEARTMADQLEMRGLARRIAGVECDSGDRFGGSADDRGDVETERV